MIKIRTTGINLTTYISLTAEPGPSPLPGGCFGERWIAEKAQEYGVKIHRGLYKCPRCGLEANADINACLNIARKAGYTLPAPSKIEAFIPTHQGVVAATEKKKTTTGSQRITPRRGNREPALVAQGGSVIKSHL
ncbi:hypothetical protein MA03_06995 [Infirmifilum uzonense]|uniref:Uncharacterized protein n=1 Tax=Infirmifilum uzonense TaxID=1550241 RepID=A0A0F7CL98_9CREN|nr:zinc ribbon domain-containing protein [Infirmifilum uzonense]AKG39036.1 hypothetical protein MA03_06995 [Infirmifilum uzonense]